MIRLGPDQGPRPPERRQLLRMSFLGIAGLAVTELAVALAPFLKVSRVTGLGSPVNVGTKAVVPTTGGIRPSSR